MTYLQSIAYLLALLPYHFVADWALQPYRTAMSKATNWIQRTNHVIFYTMCMTYGLISCGLRCELLTVLAIAVPHWLIDTYRPVYWWCKYMQDDPNCENIETFRESFKAPRQIVMYIVLDQLFHILTLIPVLMYLSM